jgi:hypothetical protein
MSGCATYLPVNMDQSRLLPERQQQMVDQVKAAMSKGDITGLSLAVVDKAGLLWSGNFGFADKNSQRTPLSKRFIGLAPLQNCLLRPRSPSCMNEVCWICTIRSVNTCRS